MKKLFLLVLFPFITFAQEYYVGELKIQLINTGASWNVVVGLWGLGTRWDENYEITEGYYTIGERLINPNTEGNFDHILDPGSNQEFAIGIYKVIASEGGVIKAYFFMDWRTSDWSSSLDVNFKYDVGNHRFRNWANTETFDFSYQTLWDLTDKFLETDGLEDYWDNCLVVTNDANNHPRLVFGPYFESITGTITGYKVYRSATYTVGQEPSNFTLIETLDPDEFIYVDNSVTIGNDYNAKSYYVTCAYEDPWESTGETGPTNTVEVILAPPQKISLPEQNPKQDYTFQLKQNFPNPFNPTTIISWQSTEDNFVTLKVYDVLGREITTLVNEYRQAGTHSVEFNSSDLPSGVYLYRIQIGDFTDSRKLMLQK
ncbi:MAG: T9SS type A sorting domain-containing protein [Ignavibacteria bacterium]|nr:T9SS type A sorting domain-containing protein [Ignavibacteria bacterium]